MASASADGTVRLWNTADPAQPSQELDAKAGDANTIAFSHDGRMLASGHDDRTIRLWNLTDPARAIPLGQPLTGHVSGIRTLAFDPGDRTLASAGADHTIRLWQLDVAQTIRRVCDTTRNVLTENTWREYVSRDLPYWSACTP